MLTILTNIRSCIMHHASCIMHHATSRQGRRLKFGMLTVLTNIRSTKVLLQDGHHYLDGDHPITTFSNIHKFGSQKYLPDRNLALKYH